MYHDQGHIPIKLVARDRAVNVTLGLPIVRTSPSHGTAFDIAWKGVADAEGMVEAIRTAALLARTKRKSVRREPRRQGAGAMSVSGATTLYLVRHGATDANLKRPYVLQGRGMDLPLNEMGRRQAQCVRRLFERKSLAAIYTSPLRRAFDTAQAIAEPHRIDLATVEGLIEADVGKWEGMAWEQIRRQYPQEYEDFQRDQSQFPYLGGESYRDVSLRVLPVLEGLFAAAPRPLDCRRRP